MDVAVGLKVVSGFENVASKTTSSGEIKIKIPCSCSCILTNSQWWNTF